MSPHAHFNISTMMSYVFVHHINNFLIHNHLCNGNMANTNNHTWSANVRIFKHYMLIFELIKSPDSPKYLLVYCNHASPLRVWCKPPWIQIPNVAQLGRNKLDGGELSKCCFHFSFHTLNFGPYCKTPRVQNYALWLIRLLNLRGCLALDPNVKPP